jgi:UDP-N-acetylmuramoylalanine-D-glutamate ligase
VSAVLVIGFGVTGRAAARAAIADGAVVTVVDDRVTPGAAAAA